jgi:uncharacterized protein YhdP
VEAELKRVAPGVDLRWASLEAQRDPLRGLLRVTATDVTARGADIPGTARIASLRIDLDQWALLNGDVQVERVLASGVRAALPWSLQALRESMDGPEEEPPPRFTWPTDLDRVEVREVVVDLLETDGQVAHRLVLTEAGLRRGRFQDDRVTGAANWAVSGGGQTLLGTLSADAQIEGPWRVRLGIEADTLRDLSRMLPWLGKLPQVDMPVRVDVTLEADRDYAASAQISAQKGQLIWPERYAQPLQVNGLSAQLRWQRAAQRLEIPSFTLLLDGPRLRASGSIPLKGALPLSVDASFDRLTIPQLTQYWPNGPSPNGRAWIAENIVEGRVRDGAIRVRGTLRDPTVDMGFGFDDLLVHYRRPMPPLLKANGDGRLTNQGLVLAVKTGTINGLTAVPATVRVEPFNQSPTNAIISLPLSGSLPRLLTVLDSKPLGFISRYGIAPTSVTGQVKGTVQLTIPLLRNLTIDQVQFSAQARAFSATVPDIYLGRPLTNADLNFTIMPDQLSARGTGTLGGQFIREILWTEQFSGKDAMPTRYSLRAESSVAQLAGLNIDVSAIATGPVGLRVSLAGRGGSITDGEFLADLTGTTLELPVIGVVKSPGSPGQASGRIRIGRDAVQLPDLKVDAANVLARGRLDVPMVRGSNLLTLERVDVGDLEGSATVDFATGQTTRISLASDRVNLAPILERFLRPAPLSAPAPQQTEALPVQVQARVGTVLLQNGVEMKVVTADVATMGSAVQSVQIDGLLGQSDRTRFRLAPLAADGSRRIAVTTSDAGALARGLGVFQNGKGGVLSVDADARGEGAQLLLTGKASMTNFRVTDTPALAQTLTLASLTGIRDTLSGRGIEFRDVSVPFTLRRGIIDVRGARATGPAMGITLEGQLDRSGNRTALRGVIVPSYTVNAAVGKIPIIGPVIVGGKDQGLVGFNYRIEGPIASPKVSVNTASGLAPGFLRRIFQGKAPILAEDSGADPAVPTP